MAERIFIGNIPFTAVSDDIEEFIKEQGIVPASVNVVATAGRSKGYAVATFDQSSDEVIPALNGLEFQGRQLNVRLDRHPEQETDTVAYFIGNLPFNLSWQDVKDILRDFDVSAIRVDVPSISGTNRSKGHAVVVVRRGEAAALEALNGAEMGGRVVNIHPDKFAGARQERRPHSRFLFVGNLSYTTQWQDLKDLFREAGHVKLANISTDETGKSRGYGTVEMSAEDDARKAISMFNNSSFHGRILRVHEDKFGGKEDLKVYIGNLPFDMKVTDVKELCQLDSYVQMRNGYAIASLESQQDADELIHRLNGLEVNDRSLKVRMYE